MAPHDPHRPFPSLLPRDNQREWAALEREQRRANVECELAAANARLWEIASELIDIAMELREADVEDVDAMFGAVARRPQEVKDLLTQIDALTAAKDGMGH